MGDVLPFHDIRRNAKARSRSPLVALDHAERGSVSVGDMQNVIQYLDDLRRRGFSEATIRRRRTSLTMLRAYLGDTPIFRAPHPPRAPHDRMAGRVDSLV